MWTLAGVSVAPSIPYYMNAVQCTGNPMNPLTDVSQMASHPQNPNTCFSSSPGGIAQRFQLVAGKRISAMSKARNGWLAERDKTSTSCGTCQMQQWQIKGGQFALCAASCFGSERYELSDRRRIYSCMKRSTLRALACVARKWAVKLWSREAA